MAYIVRALLRDQGPGTDQRPAAHAHAGRQAGTTLHRPLHAVPERAALHLSLSLRRAGAIESNLTSYDALSACEAAPGLPATRGSWLSAPAALTSAQLAGVSSNHCWPLASPVRSITSSEAFGWLVSRSKSSTESWNQRIRKVRNVRPWATMTMCVLLVITSESRMCWTSRKSVEMNEVTREYTSSALSPYGKRKKNLPKASRARFDSRISSRSCRLPNCCSAIRGSSRTPITRSGGSASSTRASVCLARVYGET